MFKKIKDRRPSFYHLAFDQLEERITPYADLHIVGINDVVFDSQRQILYITTQQGNVERYDVAHQQRLTAWHLGNNLRDADITPDGTTLVVAEGNSTGSQLSLYRVDLNSAQTSTITFPKLNYAAGINSLVLLSNTMGYLTTASVNVAPSITTYCRVDLTTGIVTPVGDAIRSAASLVRDEARDTMTLTSDLGVQWMSAAGTTMSDSHVAPAGPLALNADGTWAAARVQDGIAVFDQQNHAVHTIWNNNQTAFIASFDPVAPRAYVYSEPKSGSASVIIAYDTTTWSETYRLPARFSGPVRGLLKPAIANLLVLYSSNDLTVNDTLPASFSPAVRLEASTRLTVAQVGQVQSFTITARDQFGLIDRHFHDTIHFSADVSSTLLPVDYSFTDADAGVHQFTYTVNQPSSQQNIYALDVANTKVVRASFTTYAFTSSPEFLPILDLSDTLFDSARNLLYVSSRSGLLYRYDLTQQKLLEPWHVGNELRGMDLSPDGQSLYVTDSTRNLSQSGIHQVNLQTGVVVDLWFDVEPQYSTEGSFDVAFAQNGIGLISNGNNLFQVNTLTGQVTPTPWGIAGGSLTPAQSRSRILIQSSNQYRVYDSATSSLLNNPPSIYRYVLASRISADGTKVFLDHEYPENREVVNLDDGTSVAWPSFAQAGHPGVFDPLHNWFYFEQPGWLVAYDLTTGEPVAGLSSTLFPASVVAELPSTISADGRWFVAPRSNANEVFLFDLSQFISTRVDVHDVQVVEGTGGVRNAIVHVSLSQPATSEVRVDYQSEYATARSPNDFQDVHGTLVFPVGITQQTITIPIVTDSIYELDERFRINFSHSIGAFLGSKHQAWVTIVDDDPPPHVQFEFSTSSSTEDYNTERIAIKLDAPAERPITVRYVVDSSSTAIQGQDYDVSNFGNYGEVTIADLDTAYIFVSHHQDVDFEPDETVVLRLTSAVDAILGARTIHTHTIINDDPVSAYFDTTIASGLESLLKPGIHVHLAKALPYATSVGFVIQDSSTAEIGKDYVLTGNRIVFAAGQTDASLPIRIINDVLFEDDETLSLLLTDPLGGIGIGSKDHVDYTILNDDAAPTISFATDKVFITEQQRVIPVTSLVLSKPAGKPITVYITDRGGSAQAGSDYEALPGYGYRFEPGQTQLPFEVSILDDALNETAIEGTRFVLDPTYSEAPLGKNRQFLLYIRDNDTPPTASFVARQTIVNESADLVTIAVHLNKPSGQLIELSAVIAAGSTARLGIDYVWVKRTVLLQPGETEGILVLRVLNNSIRQPKRTLSLNLISYSPVIVKPVPFHQVLILDDD